MTILDDARAGMDPSIRIQDDLFGHVNGRWLEETEIPADRSSWGPFVQLADAAEQQVRAIIEALADRPDEELDADGRRIGGLYTSFLDEGEVERRGMDPIRPTLERVRALRGTREMTALLGELERAGAPGLFGSYVSTDAKDSDRYLVLIAQGGLGLPDESYYREEKFAEIRGQYVDHLQRVLTLADQPDPEGSARRILEIDTRLAEGHWARADTRDVQKTYNLTSLEVLRGLCPAFDWDGYVAGLSGEALDVEAVLGETCVRQPSYLRHLSTVLEDVPVEDWKPWLASRVLRGAAPYLPGALVEANFEFYGRTLSGTPELRARWKRGVAFVEGVVGEAVGREYVARHFPPEAKTEMDRLVENLLQAYRQSIAALDWMTEETKDRAFQKIETFRPKIGYPDSWRDYSALEVSADDLLGNARASAGFETDRELAKLGGPVDRDEWFMLPQMVNAYYNPGTNEICFPAAILQKPFFSPDADPAENYGGIGAVIGHEIGHGFDDQGAQYDARGNLHDWWTATDKAAFQQRSAALVQQYDGLEPRSLPGEHVNGSLTVGENIGDLGGLTIGLRAYRIALGEQPVPERDGLTGVQRLFLNWAFVWRFKRRKELDLQYLTVDPHSPPEFRANIVRNLDEFHHAFGTAEGDGLWLDPAERVRIW